MFPADQLPILLTNGNNNNSILYISLWTTYHQLSTVSMSIRGTEAVSSRFKQMWYITYEVDVDVMSSSEWFLCLINYISTNFFKFTQPIKSSISRCCSVTCNSDNIKSMHAIQVYDFAHDWTNLLSTKVCSGILCYGNEKDGLKTGRIIRSNICSAAC